MGQTLSAFGKYENRYSDFCSGSRQTSLKSHGSLTTSATKFVMVFCASVIVSERSKCSRIIVRPRSRPHDAFCCSPKLHICPELSVVGPGGQRRQSVLGRLRIHLPIQCILLHHCLLLLTVHRGSLIHLALHLSSVGHALLAGHRIHPRQSPSSPGSTRIKTPVFTGFLMF